MAPSWGNLTPLHSIKATPMGLNLCRCSSQTPSCCLHLDVHWRVLLFLQSSLSH